MRAFSYFHCQHPQLHCPRRASAKDHDMTQSLHLSTEGLCRISYYLSVVERAVASLLTHQQQSKLSPSSQQLLSHDREYTAKATSDSGPHCMAKYSLQLVDSLHSAYSIDCIAVTCYNIQVMSDYVLILGSLPIAMHSGSHNSSQELDIAWRGT
jgi:hypothetical protein